MSGAFILWASHVVSLTCTFGTMSNCSVHVQSRSYFFLLVIYFFVLTQKSNKKSQGRQKWLKFTAFRYSEEAYYVAIDFYSVETYELLCNATQNLHCLTLHSVNS